MEDVSHESPRNRRVDGFLHVADSHRSRPVRGDRAVASSSAHRPLQRHGAPNSRVDRPTSRRRLSGRHRAQMIASRSRQRAQRDVPASRGGHGHRRSDLSPGESGAESVRGTRDRLDPSRMPGSCSRAQSGASATRALDLQSVLPSQSDASGARDGRARSPTRLGTVRWRDHRDSGSRRSPSPVRTKGRVTPDSRRAVLDGGGVKVRTAWLVSSVDEAFAGARVTLNAPTVHEPERQSLSRIVRPVKDDIVLANDTLCELPDGVNIRPIVSRARQTSRSPCASTSSARVGSTAAGPSGSPRRRRSASPSRFIRSRTGFDVPYASLPPPLPGLSALHDLSS
jgi:hypothetical protein